MDATDRINNTSAQAGANAPLTAGTTTTDQAAPQAPPAPQPHMPVAMAIPAPMTKSVPFEGLHSSIASSDAPYAVAQPTPNGLPPIATARPLHGIGAINSHLAGGSNIPMVNGVPQQPPHGHLPHIATTVPTGLDYEHSRFEFMDKTRWVAAVMLMYYIATFVFFQPFILGVMGMMTAFMGYYGARPPMDAVRMKWVRSYLWLNYIMIVLNVCMLGITFTFIAIHSASTAATTATATDDDSDDDYAAYYASTSVGIIVALLVALNIVFHVRGIQTARAFYAELERAEVQHVQPALIVMTATHVA